MYAEGDEDMICGKIFVVYVSRYTEANISRCWSSLSFNVFLYLLFVEVNLFLDDLGGKGDIVMITNGIKLMVEVKNYNINVPTKEQDKFHRDLLGL